jgi:hypothetical protein
MTASTDTLSDDALIPFSAVRRLPMLALLTQLRGGRGIWPSTLHKWHKRGERAADGTIVKLRAVRWGRCYVTRASWLMEFAEALARQPGEGPIKQVKTHTAAAASLAAQGL